MADMDPGEGPSTKFGKYRKIGNNTFECLLCNRHLSSKRNVLKHLNSRHGLTPVKRIRKRYLEDSSIPVPKSTVHNWKKSKLHTAKKSLKFQHNRALSASCDEDLPPVADEENTEVQVLSPSITDAGDSETSHDHDAAGSVDIEEHTDIHLSAFDSEDTSLPSSCCISSPCETEEELSDDDDDDMSTQSSDVSSSFTTNTSDDENSHVTDEEEVPSVVTSDSTMSDQETQALTILSCFLRNSLSATACKDILQTMKTLFPESNSVNILDFRQILSHVDATPVKEIHYCVVCNEVFPDNEDFFRCAKENCEGLRYKGSLAMQQKKGRKPRQCFVFADIEHQLKSLLQTPGIWDDIQSYKGSINRQIGSGVITDITDGSCYQDLLSDNGFIGRNKQNLTAIFNTDGVNLYSSSKIELWPIFLAINELSPPLRFARENMLLVGIWQGKGKPLFRQYMEAFCNEMNSLYDEGINIHTNHGLTNVKVAVLCGIADLPAKAGLLNMTMYNGCQACITCEEPGLQVKQGKGTSRCYPYRPKEERPALRESEHVLECMRNGNEKNRCKGFKGMSGLQSLHSMDIVKGMVPDYMHGILLGITKTLLNKWFAPSQSGKEYFLGKSIKDISKRMQEIKPPLTIERLPRDLEKHYNNFKATELQAWLLYYALPCLDGYLPDAYMRNLACLSEGIYILLGDFLRQQDLERAEILMDEFYSTFEVLYGQGSTGLNVHNAGLHLVQYVKLWGPLWAWSCFPFEDTHAMLLQSVHGTGIVLNQIMRYKQAQICIRKKGFIPEAKTSLKITLEADNCSCAGRIKKFTELGDDVIQKLGVTSLNEVGRIDRILVDGKRFFAGSYSRMQKRVCNVVLYEHVEERTKIGSITHFVYLKEKNTVVAVVDPFEISRDRGVQHGKHLTEVKASSKPLELVKVESLIDSLVYICPKNLQGHEGRAYVAKMANKHGHAVFK